METVKEFIERISSNDFYGDEVNVLVDEEKNKFLNEYLRKLQALATRKNKVIDIDFLRENLNRNVKYVVDVTYTDEEKKLGEQSTGYNDKQSVGARPGQYVQGRIVYSNLAKKILIDHETTHAARLEIISRNGEYIVPFNIADSMPITTDTIKFLRQIPDSYSSTGYDKTDVDENGNLIKLSDFEEMSDLMEICTESIAGMMNEPDEKTFEKFSIPTGKMSAISFYRHTRDLLIMAIGSDEFILDMLSRDSSVGIDKLTNMMQMYKDDASIVDYLRIAGENARCQGKIERGEEKDFVKKRMNEYLEQLNSFEGSLSDNNYQKIMQEYEKCKKAIDNGEEKQYVAQRRDDYLQRLEDYIVEIFLNRLEHCQDIDKGEQISYFLQILETEKAKETVLQKLREQESKKISFFHDQKSDEFFEDMETGRYTITEQQIGKATVNTPTTKKGEAQKQVSKDEKQIEQEQELN